jgi:hypothetical protein
VTAASYTEHFAKHLRLVILRLLHEAGGYRLNSSVLTDAANAHGLAASRDQMRGELAWLAENGLTKNDEPTPGLVVATLTERGADIVDGRGQHPGVQRPSPKG